MSIEESMASSTARVPSCHVRFTREEYLQLAKDQLLTGRSIPWLLKTSYFGRANYQLMLSREQRDFVCRQIAYAGNNINQLAKHVNSGLIAEVKDGVQEILTRLRGLDGILGRTHGNGKNPV